MEMSPETSQRIPIVLGALQNVPQHLRATSIARYFCHDNGTEAQMGQKTSLSSHNIVQIR